MMRYWLVRLVAVAVATGVGSSAPPASATWPGENGRLFFSAVEDMTSEPPLGLAADCSNTYGTFLSSVEPDGSDARTVVPGGVLPALSPGDDLAYFNLGTDCNGYMSAPDYPLRVRDGTSGDRRSLLTVHDFRLVDPITTRLAWNRRGRILAYSRRGRIIAIKPASHSFRLLTRGSDATWSSRDDLALTRRRASGLQYRLLVRSGRRIRAITASDAISPDWSPDGRWIAFTRRSFRAGEVDRSAIYIIRRNGHGLRRVTDDAVRFAHAPVWSPDGQWIAFIEGPPFANSLFLVRPDGTEAHPVVREVVAPAPLAWQAVGEANGTAAGRR